MNRITILRVTALITGVFQIMGGVGYLLAPAAVNGIYGLTISPADATYPFMLIGARFLALGFGSMLVVRDPWANRGWIQAMIAVQALDGIVTVSGSLAGTMTIGQGTPLPLMPFLWVVLMLVGYPRGARPAQGAAVAGQQRGS